MRRTSSRVLAFAAVATFQSGTVRGKSAISRHFMDDAGRKATGRS